MVCTEIGRQPWIVYNLIRTSEVVAEHGAGMLLGTLLTYLTLYLVLMVSYIGALRYLSSKPAASLDDFPIPDAVKMEHG
jgi:cytochrome d ubiquinol oxidase subunit I